MDTETKQEFEKLAGMVAEGFSSMEERFDTVDKAIVNLQEEIRELRNETNSIRAELERIPDNIDATYSKTLNDLLDRVAQIEKRLDAVETVK